MSNALFVDVSNLNVLYKTSGKFCFGTSYASCPERLVIDAQALGNSFDVYLSVWPRPAGEGDAEISGLNIASMPFVVLKEEIETVLRVFDTIPGVNEIYICNALCNYLIPARVENYSTVLCAGNRFAHVTVKERQVTECKFYTTQKDFYDAMGEAYSCHGDMDLVDVDSIRAQWPEFSEATKATLVPLTPLIMSYKSGYKVPMQEVLDSFKAPAERIVEEESNRPARKTVSLKPSAAATPIEPGFTGQGGIGAKSHIDWIAAALVVAFCIGCFLNCFCYGLRDVGEKARGYDLERQLVESKGNGYTGILSTYSNSKQVLARSAEALEYSKASGLAVSVSNMSVILDEVTITFNCTSRDLRDSFCDYIGQRYEVLEVNEYSSSSNTDGTMMYQFGVVFYLESVIPVD